MTKIETLRKKIKDHDKAYYVDNNPTISDYEYDMLMKELQAIEADYPELITPDSPTQRVCGEPIKGFTQIKHTKPLLSLDNTYNAEDLKAFDSRIRKVIKDNGYCSAGGEGVRYVVELKIDGVAASATYEEGILQVVSTRGDGTIGDDITHNAKTIRTLPLKVNPTIYEFSEESDFEVRGEIYMSRKSFEQANQQRLDEGDEPFANPRNATAGTLKQFDPKVASDRKLNMFAYTLIVGDENMSQPDEQTESLGLLKDMGFQVAPVKVCTGIKEVIDYCNEWEGKRDELDFDIDGMVIKVDDLADCSALGESSKSPRWAISYKFPARQATTVVESIEVQVGRTGAITPVANLRPVPLSGVTISRATLHNADELERLGINVGDIVLIERAGEVIPKVIKVVEKHSEGTFQLPDICPSCGGIVVRIENEAATRCTNSYCPAQLNRVIEYFGSKKAMDIDGLGPRVVEMLTSSGFVKSAPDLYELTVKKLTSPYRARLIHETFSDVVFAEMPPLMSQKEAQNLIDAIERSKAQPLDRVICALGIRLVGTRASKKLVEFFDMNVDESPGLLEATSEELQVAGIGPVMAREIETYMEGDSNRDIIGRLMRAGLTMTAERKIVGDTFAGKTFVFTGTLSIPRAEAEKTVEALGGKTSSSISKKTDFLVAGENAGSKIEKALSLGVKVITEKIFRVMTCPSAVSL